MSMRFDHLRGYQRLAAAARRDHPHTEPAALLVRHGQRGRYEDRLSATDH